MNYFVYTLHLYMVALYSFFRDFKNDHIQADTLNNVIRRSIPYCGNRNPFALIIEANSSNPGGVLFQSNGDLAEQGFNASFHAVNKTPKIGKFLE